MLQPFSTELPRFHCIHPIHYINLMDCKTFVLCVSFQLPSISKIKIGVVFNSWSIKSAFIWHIMGRLSRSVWVFAPTYSSIIKQALSVVGIDIVLLLLIPRVYKNLVSKTGTIYSEVAPFFQLTKNCLRAFVFVLRPWKSTKKHRRHRHHCHLHRKGLQWRRWWEILLLIATLWRYHHLHLNEEKVERHPRRLLHQWIPATIKFIDHRMARIITTAAITTMRWKWSTR